MRALARLVPTFLLLAACGDAACPEAPLPEAAEIDPGPGLAELNTTPPFTCPGTFLSAVEGEVRDDAGASVPGTRIQLCLRTSPDGVLLCLAPPTTDAEGRFAVPVNVDSARCVDKITLRAVLPGFPAAPTYCDVPLATDERGVLSLEGALPLFRIPREDACTLPPEGDPETPRDVPLGDGVMLLGLRPSQV
ncbi:MAG: hypothetical protein AAGH15_28180, partial [Myxococcota bacterium]